MIPEVGEAPDPMNKLRSGSLETGQYRPESKVSLMIYTYCPGQQLLARIS